MRDFHPNSLRSKPSSSSTSNGARGATITGGTGFLGGAMIRQLVRRFDTVRVLVRKPRDDERIRRMGAEPVRGDLTSPGGCDELIRPGDIIYHAAAKVELRGRWRDFQATTVEGTRRLVDAAVRKEASRFVNVSSASVYAPEAAGDSEGVRADRTPTGPRPYNFYGRAKLEAEQIVQRECERAGLPWTTVRLGFCYGAGNRALLTDFVPRLKRGRLFLIGDGRNRIATCYIDDAARAVMRAGIADSVAGKIYDVASDEHVTQKRFVDGMADAVGLPRTEMHVRADQAYRFALLLDMLAKIPGCEPQVGRLIVRLMAADQVVDASLTRRDLGWAPEIDLEEGLRRTAAWYADVKARQDAQRLAVRRMMAAKGLR